MADGYGPREAVTDFELALKESRRQLLRSNDEHGNKVMRKKILDEFAELFRFLENRMIRAGVLSGDSGQADQ